MNHGGCLTATASRDQRNEYLSRELHTATTVVRVLTERLDELERDNRATRESLRDMYQRFEILETTARQLLPRKLFRALVKACEVAKAGLDGTL